MFRLKREKILPLFLERRMSVAELARLAAVSQKATWRAVTGRPVSAKIIGRVADALGLKDTLAFLSPDVEVR